MSVPAKRLAKRRKRIRNSHTALKQMLITECAQCKKPALPHHACAFCGYYRGRKVADYEPPQLKKARKAEKVAKKAEEAEKSDQKNTKPEQKNAIVTS